MTKHRVCLPLTHDYSRRLENSATVYARYKPTPSPSNGGETELSKGGELFFCAYHKSTKPHP